MDKNKKIELWYIIFLLLGCGLFLFATIGLYPLIDIDETRYVNMSKFMYLTKQYLTPVLNFEPFLEKPPLYFWLNTIAFSIFKNQSVFVCRFMTALMGSIGVFSTYFFVKKISNHKLYGFLSANVLLASAWFLVFTHVAILDLNFMVLTMLSIYFAIIPLFDVQEKNKKYFWYFAYLFMALSVLAKGFIGIAIPTGVVFFTYLIFKKVKELFKLSYIIPGLIIFLIVGLPWHISIYEKYGQSWINMYILKHHFARLLNSQGLGRKQPFMFYVPIVFIGLIPWTFNFIVLIVRDFKRVVKKFQRTKTLKEFLNIDTVDKKVMTFGYIYVAFVFLFFSSASTKLPPYILTLFPGLSIIVGNLWYHAIKNNEYKKEMLISNYINSILFLIVSFLGIIFAFTYKIILPDNIEFYIDGAISFGLPALIFVFLVSLFSFISIKKEKFIQIFILHIALMLGAVYVTCDFGIPYYTSFAQDELEQYANFINQQKNSQTVTYGFSAKYSILNPKKKIKYIIVNNKNNYKELMQFVRKNKKRNVYVLTRTNVDELDNKKTFKKVKEGKVYKLYIDTLK